MLLFPHTIILRHRKENLKKCSLRGLETRPDFQFFTYPLSQALPDLSSHILLSLGAPPLTEADKDLGLFLIDGTWRHTDTMFQQLHKPQLFTLRSIPSTFQTAYPRRQDDCPDPSRGLASIEALFIAYHILGRSTDGLLDFYHWKDSFLLKNNIKQ